MKKINYHFSAGFVFLHYLIACSAMSTTNITTDQSALLALRAHITSDPLQILANNWSSTSTNICEWIGVTCGSRHRRVTALDISNMGLAGTVPQQLGNLSFLVSLNMSGNNFRGELPQELVHLRRLRILDFGINNFTGELPSWIGSLQKLQNLNLRNNSFSGFIPPSIANITNLQRLDLSFNFLEGTLPKAIGNYQNLKTLIIYHSQLSGSLPWEMFNISSLETIAFQGNSLSGSLPDNICHRLKRLKWLDLSYNNISGRIPSMLSRCPQLQELSLSINSFTGPIPKEIGNLTVLEKLFLNNNQLTGTIPDEIGKIQTVKILNLGHNRLKGSIPVEIFNLSSLQAIGLYENNLSGNLPASFGHGLPNLESISLARNNLYGVLPASISNASKLGRLSFAENKFSGPILDSPLANLRFLEILDLGGNNLTSDSSSLELKFITSLTNCRYLKVITVNENPLKGILPKSVGNLSSSMERIFASGCEIMGKIPSGFGNLSNLLALSLYDNQFTGFVATLSNGLQKLQLLDLGNNQLSGPIPENLCNLKNLFNLFLSQNQISGSVPSCLGNVTSFREIYFASNLLNSTIPNSLWELNDLLVMDMSNNFFTGSLPEEVQNLKSALRLNLSVNRISGNIPSSIGGLQNLVFLSLTQNRLQGPIPVSIGQMLSLQFLDLSDNDLSGEIPNTMEKLSYLNHMNLSFNHLRGEIPPNGPFKNFKSQAFISNDALCGAPRFRVPPCTPSLTHKSSRNKKLHVIYIVFSIGTSIIVVTSIMLFLKYRRKSKVVRAVDLLPLSAPERISYYELLQATDGYNDSNLLGAGSFGSVYKGTFMDGTLVAVKVFNLQLEGTHKSFLAECDVLRNLRHRNLTKVIGICSNNEFKALVLEYMPNGNLETWLYSHNNYLDVIQRISIMMDVACALEYLHCGYTTPVVHCDLKPSNILLDGSMAAHVCDFGLTKLLGEEESELHTKTLATLGYIAPEYGSEGQVSTRVDVYSFGIVLMETFSRMKPTDEMFSGDLSLKCWIEGSLQNGIANVTDTNLLRAEDNHFTEKLECISTIFELGLSCCRECPRDRISMKDVVVSLEKIKHQLISVSGGQI